MFHVLSHLTFFNLKVAFRCLIHEHSRAIRDVQNALFEIGVLDSPNDTVNLSDDLRNDIGLDSQELVCLAVALSSLVSHGEPMNEFNANTVGDLVVYVETNRDSWLPTDVPYVLQSSTTINQSLEWVQSCIADYQKWPEILSHVTKIEPEYDDGNFQTFKMHIEELNTKEHYFVQSWRYVNLAAGIIDFTQPKPPFGFKTHKGGWRFKSQGPNKTELISYHGFDLNEQINVEDSMMLIHKHIHAALTTWAKYGDAQ